MPTHSIDAGAGVQIVASGDYKATDPAVQDIETNGAVSLRINVRGTDVSGGGGVTVTISGIDPATGVLHTLLTSALIATATFNTYVVDPRIAAAANAVAQAPLPSKVRVAFVGSGTRTTLTYSASAVLAN